MVGADEQTFSGFSNTKSNRDTGRLDSHDNEDT